MKTKLLKPIWLAAMLLLLSSVPLTANAHDFEVGGIYYLIDGTNATVTYRGSSINEYSNEYSGNVVIPESVTYNGATYSVTSIGLAAFYRCSDLTSVTIGNSVTYIGQYAFAYCSGLTSITIGNSVTSIGNYAFYECSSLTSVTIPNSVTSIRYEAFYGCSGLTSVTIPNSVTSIGESAFSGCSGLESITVDSGNPSYDSRNNCNAIIETATNKLISGCKNTVIPNSVTSIGNGAFYNCSGLTGELVIPNSVTSIGGSAFRGCSGLTSVTIPNSVTSIGGSAFQDCSGLTSVTIPNSVTTIGYGAFMACRGLTSVTIGNSVTTIGNYAFYECSSLTSVTIPNSITSIGEGLFSSCSGLTSITIPNSVTSIGYKAFWGCSGLTSITIGNSVASIGRAAFYNCSGLTGELVIPNSVTSIGVDAFAYCSGLTSVTIPNSVTSIGGDAFYECSGLTSVHITDLAAWCNIAFGSRFANPLYCAHHLFLNGTEVKDLVIPNSINSIGNYAFQLCSGLTSVTIPNSVTSIGYGAFSGCSGLTSITIPNSVTSIGEYAFANCFGLNSVIIPNSVTSIGNSAFNYCGGLTSIYNHINHPTNVTLGSYVFDGVNKTNCTLYVIAGRVDEYRTADQWKDFVNIVEGNYLVDISFENDFLTLYLGETDTLQVQHTPASVLCPPVLWQSSDTTVATVDQNGRITPITLGQTVITATTTTDDGLNLSASCTVYVRAHVSSISLDKDSTILYLNETDTLTATVLPEFAFNEVVNWSSSDANVATVDQNGVVTAHAVGNAIITATTTDGTSLSDSCLVEVRAYVTSISLDKTQTSIYVGGNDSIAATILPENAYNKTLLWQSSDPAVATVDQNGKVTAVALGQAVITASTTDGTNLSASCQVNVTGITSIALNKTSTLLYLEETDNLTATITPADVIINTIAWTSSNPSVASVNPNGKVTAHAVGTAIITATTTDGTNLTASCAVEVRAYVSSVTLDKTDIEMYVGGSETITATVLPENAYNRGLQWQTSNLSVASVDQNGKVTATGLGTAIIVAKTTDGSNLMATCEVNVTGVTSLTLDESDITLFAGTSQTLVATISPSDVIVSTLQWQSSDPTVATVNQNGKVVALAAGTTTITATTTDGTNLSASCQVTVWPQYALAAPGIEHTRGEQPLVVEYAVEMFNKNAITGLQFEMQLPDSISLMDDSYGYPDIWLDENRRARSHSVDVTELGDNYYKVMISSPTNKEFKGNSGNLFYMRLLVDKYHASGIYNIGLTGIVLAEPDETEHQVDDTSFDVQYNYMLGDADADVHVDVGDYITTALYIMNKPTIRFYEDAANVHTANDAINVTDLTGITNIALGIRPTEILHAPALGDAELDDNNEPELGVSVKRLDADRWMMSVDLSNRQPMAAMQLDLQLPDGVSYESASLTDRAGKLQLTDGILPDGTLRLLMSAFSADDIEAGEGDVINIVLKGNPVAGGMATFHNMIVAERNLNSYEPEPMMVPFVPTAIDGATLYNEVRIYGEKGNVVIESPVAGTAQLVLLNGIATPLEVQPGRNVYPVESNEYYIVRFNGVTAKLRF